MFVLKNTIYLLTAVSMILAGNCNILSSNQFTSGSSLQNAVLSEMIPLDKCNEPCLFGAPLENLTYDEVHELLIHHPFTSDAIFTFEPNRIIWTWPQSKMPMLLSDGYSGLSYFYDLNRITFEQGKVSEIAIAFGYSLKDIIQRFGNEFAIYPYVSTMRAGDSYILKFAGIDGWFRALHNCDLPHFTPETFVVMYLYFSNYVPDYVNQGVPPVKWVGYETQIQGCSAFIPG
ncbi:MAG: hypothetical protein HND46_19490 [Chloroflexi bacterium]|nr:hypothetical protein [Chloroflexota bacterium]